MFACSRLTLSSVAVMKEHSYWARKPGPATVARWVIRAEPLSGFLYAPIKKANMFLCLMKATVERPQPPRER